MNKITIVLACLACAGYGRRVQTSMDQHKATQSAESRAPFKPLTQLARLILEPDTDSAFNPASAAPVASLQPKVHASQNRLGSAGPQMYKQKKTVKALRNRMRQLNAFATVTYTMKLVAAAKVRRAQQAVLRARPFNEDLERIIGGLLSRLDEDEDLSTVPLLEEREVKSVAIVFVSGDRGLCGPYNNRMKREVEARFQQLEEQGYKVYFYPIGYKGFLWLNKEIKPSRISQVITWFECGLAPTSAQAKNISDAVLNGFFQGTYDRVELIYTEFINFADQKAAIRTLIPILPTDLSLPNDEVWKLTSKKGELGVEKESIPVAPPQEFSNTMVFEQEPAQLLNTLLPLYFNGQLLRCLQEGVAGELAARMQAMDQATTNAKKMERKTTILMHKTRRDRINLRLAEIVLNVEMMRMEAIAKGESNF